MFPNGCHVAEVEVDPDTGVIEVVSYNSVNDFGTIINPLLVAGQVHGGVVQGIGQALMENTAYDADGQLLTGSYMDYAMPRAADMPEIGFESHPVPAKNNPLGVKGCGEAGCAGALTSMMNAIVDALSEYGVDNIDMPATPERVWKTIQEAKARTRCDDPARPVTERHWCAGATVPGAIGDGTSFAPWFRHGACYRRPATKKNAGGASVS